MPIVRPIYRTTKQIFQTLFSGSESSFRHVGLVEFPAPGMWSLVFLTQPPTAPIAAHLPQTEHVSAFLPCTPNPTTGFFFYVPRRDVIDLDITVEQAMSLLISAGIIQPGGEDPQSKLAALAETARAAQARARRRRARRNRLIVPSPRLCRGLCYRCARADLAKRGDIMGFCAGDFGRLFQLREFPRPRLPVGILVLGSVRHSSPRS